MKTSHAKLCDEYVAYCIEHGLPTDLSADELQYELLGSTELTAKAHVLWLEAFINEWNTVQS